MKDIETMGKTMGKTAAKILAAFNLLAETLNNIFFVYDSYDSYGQGAVFHSLCDYFNKDKIKSCLLLLILTIHAAIKKIIFFRKTTKSFKEPIRLHGWKGGR